MIRNLHAAALSLLIATCPALAAKDPETVAEVDNKSIDASIVVDNDIKAYPALYQKLIANSKKAYDDARATARQDLKEHPDQFKDGRKHYYQRSYLVRSIIGPYISILDREETYTGGAHPNHGVDTLLWDAQTGRMMNIKPFFKEMADNGPTLQLLARELRAALLAEKKARGVEVANPTKDEWLANVKPRITAIGGIAFAPSTDKDKSSGLIAYFSPYAVGPYAEGEYSVFIPYAAFQSALSATGVSLFGGMRPTGGDRNN